jgi:nucleotide-binding universal stress UspA family protein
VANAERLRQASREEGTEILNRAVELARQAGIEAETVLLEADWRHFSAAIVEEALRWSAELIVLGTHGRTGLARLVLGSVAERMVHIAPVPALLVRCHRGAAG